MLIYRALSSNYNYCTYHNEIDAYLNGALCALPSGTKIFNNNTFNYRDSRYYHHFFVFAEDATKFLFTKKNVTDYQIGEFEIDDGLVPFYSGFGAGYEFTMIPNYVLKNCAEKKIKVEQITKPSFEIALPTQLLKKDYFVQPNYDVLNRELSEEFENEHYFELSCLKPTGNLFEFGDENIKSCYREAYLKYQEGLYYEFLKAYMVEYNEEKDEISTSTYGITDEDILIRKKVLQENRLIK